MAIEPEPRGLIETEDTAPSLFSGISDDLVSQLSPAKIRYILMFLTGQYTQKKIGQILGVSHVTLKTWSLDPAVQKVIAEIQKREFEYAESKLKSLTFKAIDTMEELLESDMDNVRFQASKDLLDRSGHKPQQNIKVDKTVTTREQQLAALAEFMIDDAEVVDVQDVKEVQDE